MSRRLHRWFKKLGLGSWHPIPGLGLTPAFIQESTSVICQTCSKSCTVQVLHPSSVFPYLLLTHFLISVASLFQGVPNWGWGSYGRKAFRNFYTYMLLLPAVICSLFHLWFSKYYSTSSFHNIGLTPSGHPSYNIFNTLSVCLLMFFLHIHTILVCFSSLIV